MSDNQIGMFSRAALIHGVLLAAVVMMAVVLGGARQVVDLQLDSAIAKILRYVAVAELIGAGVVIRLIRDRVPLKSAVDDAEAWWRSHGARVFATWGLAEGSALAALVIWFLTGDILVLALVFPAALILLLRLRPSGWQDLGDGASYVRVER